MTQNFGELYRFADFLQHCLEKEASADEFGKILAFLRDLDVLQGEVDSFFFRVRAGGASGGLRFLTRDSENDFFLLPRRGWLKVSTYCKGRMIQSFFKEAAEKGGVEALKTSEAGHRAWRVGFDELSVIIEFLRDLVPFDDEVEAISGPRSFPRPVKQAALGLHFLGGSICAGADGKSPHKVNETDFEFDHRYPYAKGGASEAWNIQVLCRKCNRDKRARVWDWQSGSGFENA